MKKILIIGADGMLGQELVSAFKKDKDCKVIAWDKKDLDIAKEKAVDAKIKVIKPEIIINAAAYNAVDKCETNKKELKSAMDINGKAPGYLAKTAKKLGAILVHYSTDYVFDGDVNKLINDEPSGCTHVCSSCTLHQGHGLGYAEDANPNAISQYGKSKMAGEKAVQKNAKKYYLIRTSKLFGQPAKNNPPTGGAKKSFFDVMLELGKNPPAGGKEIKVVDEETSCFTYVPDLAKKTKEIIDSQKPFGIYHVVNSDPCTWYEAVLELYKQAKIKMKIIPVLASEFPRPARRPFYSVLINTKLNPMRSYKEAIKEYLKTKNKK